MIKPENIAPILIVDLSKWYGGVDARVLETAFALHGHRPYAVVTLQNSPIHKRLVEANLVAMPLHFSRCSPRLLFAILSAIRQYGYKVVDAHNPQSQFWGLLAARLARVPVMVTTVHSSYGIADRGLKGWLYEWVLNLNARWNCHFIAVSETVCEYLQQLGIQNRQISLIHNSIHMSEQYIKAGNSSLRESLGWGKDTYVVIVVGRLEPVKGLNYLIEALSLVVKDRPQIRCLFVGEGRVRRRLEAQVRQLHLEKWVHFAGFCKDTKTLLNASDAFCMPSLSEGLPYALLEACACRLPLLVTEVGGMAKLLTNGETAILVPSGNSEVLAKGLFRLIDNPKENAQLGNAAFKLVCEKLSSDHMISKTLTIYDCKITPKNIPT